MADKREPKFDEIDFKIIRSLKEREIKNKKTNVGDLRKLIGITQANLNNHLKRLTDTYGHLPPVLKKERDQVTIYLSFTEFGEKLCNLLLEAWNKAYSGDSLEETKNKAKALEEYYRKEG